MDLCKLVSRWSEARSGPKGVSPKQSGNFTSRTRRRLSNPQAGGLKRNGKRHWQSSTARCSRTAKPKPELHTVNERTTARGAAPVDDHGDGATVLCKRIMITLTRWYGA